MADNLQGDGFARVSRALDRLEDLLGLGRARMRFSQSPPPYTLNPSGTTTRSASPDTRRDEQQRRERRRYQLISERAASLPQEQFEDQVEEERKQIWYADPRTRMSQYRSIDTTFEEDARETVKKRWVEQGIWKKKWGDTADGLWKHEEPLELESDFETGMEAVSLPRPFSFDIAQKPPLSPKPSGTNSKEEKQRAAERRVLREREREASRPYYQFAYQISKERERIQDEFANREGVDAADINTRAYENVKNTWTNRRIWNGRWGILPRMEWKHERSLEEEAVNDPAPISASPPVNGSHNGGEALTRGIFGPHFPVPSNLGQTSGMMSMSRQELSADDNSARLENTNAVRSPSTSNTPCSRMGKRVLRPTSGQALRPSTKLHSCKVGQPQPVASGSLGPVHTSKVSKATGMRRPVLQQRPSSSPEVSSGDPPILSGQILLNHYPRLLAYPHEEANA